MNKLPELSDSELINQYDEHIKLIKDSFGDTDRTTNILKMYEDLKHQIMTAPASGKINYHCCWVGGYLFHVNNVIKCTMEIAKLYKKMGGVVDFTKEELLFSTIFHDLGKVGTSDGPYYIPQESEWHRNKLGEMFVHNPEVQFLNVYDGTVFLLNQYNIRATKTELTAIKLANGMYSDENFQYLKYERSAGAINNLCYIIHWGDHMATLTEKDLLR